MGFGGPSMPPMPTYTPPEQANEQAKRAQVDRRKQAAAAMGRGDTILTGPPGSSGSSSSGLGGAGGATASGAKTLLGM